MTGAFCPVQGPRALMDRLISKRTVQDGSKTPAPCSPSRLPPPPSFPPPPFPMALITSFKPGSKGAGGKIITN
eukprot:203287-Pyramimonas_sp.AAC.1